jgi:hypothetical protein
MDVQPHRDRPRSFYPHFVDDPPPRHGRPGWDMGPERRIDDGRTLARAMAWFSIGLGALEILGARPLTRFLGVDERHTTLIRAYGVREVLTGISIMAERTPTIGVWSRVAGDALDMATLGMAFRRDDPRPGGVALAALAVAGAAALDITSAVKLSRTQARMEQRENGRMNADGRRTSPARLTAHNHGDAR